MEGDESNKENLKNLRQLKYYHRKSNGKPRFKSLSLLAEKELGIKLPSAKKLLSLLLQRKSKQWLAKKMGISSMGMWKIEKKMKKEREVNLSFKNYKTLLDIAVKEGILQNRIDLENILKKISKKKQNCT